MYTTHKKFEKGEKVVMVAYGIILPDVMSCIFIIEIRELFQDGRLARVVEDLKDDLKDIREQLLKVCPFPY